jgi:hypothetical protein
MFIIWVQWFQYVKTLDSYFFCLSFLTFSPHDILLPRYLILFFYSTFIFNEVLLLDPLRPRIKLPSSKDLNLFLSLETKGTTSLEPP